MKKLFILLLSLCMSIIAPLTQLCADELSDFERLSMGDKTYEVGDVVTLPFSQAKTGGEFLDTRFLIIGKDEDLMHSYTLMAIDDVHLYYGTYDGNFDKFCETTLDFASLKSKLADGTYKDHATKDVSVSSSLIGAGGHYDDDEGMFYTIQPLTTEVINYQNSVINVFDEEVLQYYTNFDCKWKELNKRLVKVDKAYLNADGEKETLTSKFFFPSLKELGFTSNLSADDHTYSLFEEKDVLALCEENSINIPNTFSMWLRDADYQNKKITALAKTGVEYIDVTGQDRYTTKGYGFCFTVKYDEESTTYNETGVKNVALYASYPSEYYIVMPTKVFVSSNSITPFTIRAYGDVEAKKKINISIPESVSLVNANDSKSSISVLTAIEKSSLNYKDINAEGGVATTVNITAPRIGAGTWNADLEITISLS